MARSEEAIRREAVRRRLAGESPQAIAHSLGRTRQWVAKWVRRYNPSNPEWAKERSRAPRRVANRTPADLELQIVAVRARLEQDPWSQVGADAVCWELEKLGVTPPAVRTVERILARAGTKRRRRHDRYVPKGVPYPTPACRVPGDLQQADLVGPRHLDGGIPFIALNAIDVAAHACGIEIATDERASTITGSLTAILGRLGVPTRLQFDNGKPFLVGGGMLGEVVRQVVAHGAIPVFIPQGEPWRNGVIERFNDTFDQRFFRQERFTSREQIAARALLFETFHNANHRYKATGRMTPDRARDGRARRAPLPISEIAPGWPTEGRIEFIRFIRSDRTLRLLRRQIVMPKKVVYRYVTARLDLAVPPDEGNLSVIDHDGEIVLTTSVPRPG